MARRAKGSRTRAARSSCRRPCSPSTSTRARRSRATPCCCRTGFASRRKTTRRDWTDEAVGEIQAFYAQFADIEGKVPLEKYLAATLVEREALASGAKSVAGVASERGLNREVSRDAVDALHSEGTVAPARSLARTLARRASRATPRRWRRRSAAGSRRLWRFKSVGHMKAWQEPVSPVATTADVRLKIPPPAAGERRSRSTSRPAMRATGTSTTSWSGSSRGSSRRAGRTCRCATCAT